MKSKLRHEFALSSLLTFEGLPLVFVIQLFVYIFIADPAKRCLRQCSNQNVQLSSLPGSA